MKYTVYHSGTAVGILCDENRIRVYDWWLPGSAGFNVCGLHLNHPLCNYPENEDEDERLSEVIKEFETLEEFQTWFAEEYFEHAL